MTDTREGLLEEAMEAFWDKWGTQEDFTGERYSPPPDELSDEQIKECFEAFLAVMTTDTPPLRDMKDAPRDGTPILGYSNMWVRVNSGLGYHRQQNWRVLIFTKGGRTVTGIIKGAGWISAETGDHVCKPDGWMPLPAPPKDGEL